MPQDSIYKGTSNLLGKIPLATVQHDPSCLVSPENTCFPTSFDLGPELIVVPASPPIWTPQQLPVILPLDKPRVDPRAILPPCPLDPMLRAIHTTSPCMDVKEIDVISDRKNLRALLNFVQGHTKGHRIDAEVIGGTVLFILGWSARAYGSSGGYGVNFEKAFTGGHSDGTIQHDRVVSYSLGGLKMLIKYEVDACLCPDESTTSTLPDDTDLRPTITTPTGLQVVSSGTLVPPEKVIEIKTMRCGNCPFKPQTMAQMWFSRTPILVAAWHDGQGRFSSMKAVNVMDSGKLKSWEDQNKEHLQKLVRLLEMVKLHLTTSPIKKQAIVLKKEGSGRSIVKFYGLSDAYELGLPDDLRGNWA